MKVLPSGTAAVREVLLVLVGAIGAAFVIGQFPQLRDWINRQWGDTPKGF